MKYIYQCFHEKTDCCFADKNYCRRYKFKIKLKFCNHASALKCESYSNKGTYTFFNNKIRLQCSIRYGMITSPFFKVSPNINFCNENINDGIL